MFNEKGAMDPREWNDPLQAIDCAFIITEIADPKDDPQARFVEIYSPTCAGKNVPSETKLVHWVGDAIDPTAPVDLSGMRMPENGILVICATGVYTGRPCDIIPDDLDNATNNDGHNQVGMVRGTRTLDDYETIDLFGVIGEDGSGTSHDFEYGRAVRNRDVVTGPSGNTWIPNQWIVVPGQGDGEALVEDCDPGEWVRIPLVLIITEVADPQDDENKRFVELYSPNRRNYKITDVSPHMLFLLYPLDCCLSRAFDLTSLHLAHCYVRSFSSYIGHRADSLDRRWR